MVTAISDVRTVPVQEDLTTEDLSLQVLRGLDKMHRADYPYDTGVSLLSGEWGVLATDGKVDRPTATPVPNTYLVFCGTDRFDAKATGMVTLIMASKVVAKTKRYDNTVTYAAGDYLTVKDRGGGQADVTKAAGADHRVAKVVEVGTGYLVFEVL